MKNPKRCAWCLGFDRYIEYHDKEWGVPVHDDRTHFEFLILEGAQAGLSWATVLKKREGYRKAFAQFDPEKVALFTISDVERLLTNPNIIRNKLKIRSAINNAICYLEIQREFGSFDNYIWPFVGNRPITNAWESPEELPASSEASDLLSDDLRKRGFKFAGSTIMYAHMQACGLINDHLVDCFRYNEVKKM